MDPIERLRLELEGHDFEEEEDNYIDSYLENNDLILPEVPIIPITDKPKLKGDWMLEPLYKKRAPLINRALDTNKGMEGKQRIWYIQYCSEEHCLYITHGLLGSKSNNCKLQTNKIQIELNTSGRNYQEQAYQEAKYRYVKKCRGEGYHVGYDNENIYNTPMLGYKYSSRAIKKWPVYVDMKLDGIRGIVKYCQSMTNSSNIKLVTRQGKNYKWLEDQREELEIFLNYLPANSQLDCELWHPDYNRNKIQSILLTTKFKHKLNNTIEFYVFDIIEPESKTLTERWKLLLEAYRQFIKDNPNSKYIKLLNKYLAYSHKEVIYYHDYFVKNFNAEGAMVKKIANQDIINKTNSGLELNKNETKELNEAMYNCRRCTSMYKLKNFHDDEGIVVDYDIASGTQDGCIIFVIEMKNGKRFRIGSFEGIDLDQRRLWASKADNYIGMLFTYKYQILSEYGIPQHPTGLGFRLIL